MRPTPSALAALKPRHLRPGHPTGLTGLLTHPSPRPTLIHLYTRTLAALTALPAGSAYRAALEALTRDRLAVVTATRPAGYERWAEAGAGRGAADGGVAEGAVGRWWAPARDERDVAWDGEPVRAEPEGARTRAEKGGLVGRLAAAAAAAGEDVEAGDGWVGEPPLEVEQ
jgi:hypothetical protein